MPYISSGSYGIRRLLDSFQTFVQANHPVYLRTRNFTSTGGQLWSQLGFRTQPVTGQTGTTDTLIFPTPSAKMMSVKSIGESMGKYRFGARTFTISHSFALLAIQALNLTGTPDMVWRGPQTIGLVLDSQLFSIEDIGHEEWLGDTITWNLACNAAETG